MGTTSNANTAIAAAALRAGVVGVRPPGPAMTSVAASSAARSAAAGTIRAPDIGIAAMRQSAGLHSTPATLTAAVASGSRSTARPARPAAAVHAHRTRTANGVATSGLAQASPAPVGPAPLCAPQQSLHVFLEVAFAFPLM